jgi:hypothetical protein
VLKLTLEGGLVAAFKPRSTLELGDRRYKGEIAAYRLARALRLENVPIAMPRSFVASELRAAFATHGDVDEFARKALVGGDGSVPGALIPWIAAYEVLPLEQSSWRAKWRPWVMAPHVAIPDEDRPTARAVSTMIVFDYLTANWDRWSGGNIARDGATGTVLYVDNDGAFYEAPPSSALAHQLALVREIRRFSRSFVAALRALDPATLKGALGEASPGEPFLPDRIVDAVDARRSTALSAIDARIAEAGEALTLAFD